MTDTKLSGNLTRSGGFRRMISRLFLITLITAATPGLALFGGNTGPTVSKPVFPKGTPVEKPEMKPSGITGSFSTKWEVLGPGGGGTIMFPTFSPTDPNTIMVNCDMAGVYLSTNGGATWILFDNLARSNWMAFHPKDPNIILVGSNAAPMKSVDGGKTFTPDPKLVTKKSPDCAATVVLFDPDFPEMAWCSTGQWQRSHGDGGIHFSTDSGSRFQPAKGDCLRNYVWSIAVDPASPRQARRLIAGSQKGVLLSVDAGKSWKRMASWKNGESFSVAVLCPPSRDRATYFATSKSGFYRSDDRGMSWLKLDITPGTQAPEIACSPYDDKYVYASHSRGIYVSEDGGKTFTLTGTSLARLGWIESHPEYIKWANHAGTHGSHVGGLNVQAWDPKTAICSGGSTLLVTHDAGKSWKEIYTTSLDNGKTWSGYNLEVTTAYGVVFNPKAPNILLALYTDMGMFRSENYGQSWCRSMDGAKRDDGSGVNFWNTVYQAVYDPDNPDTVWITQTSKHDLPYKWQGRGDHSNKGCIARSTNGAKRFESITKGIPNAATVGLALNPDSPVGKRQLFLCVMGEGVFRSDDNGTSWVKKSKGLPNNALAWYIDIGPKEKSRNRSFRAIYVTVCRQNGAGVYRSEDYGESWSRVGNFDAPYDVRVDPDDPNRLYVTNEGSRPGMGLCLSTDRGKTWKVAQSAGRARGITINPFDKNIIFFCAGTVWVSEDRGETFRSLDDLPKRNCTRVTVDPVDPNAIWVATFGTGYFRGPWKDGVTVEKIMSMAPGSRTVAYSGSAAKKPSVEPLKMDFHRTSFPHPDPARVQACIPQLKNWIIEAIENGFDGSFKFEVFENRLMPVTVEDADEDVIEFNLDGDILEKEWDELTPDNFRLLVMKILSLPTPDQARVIAEYLVYSGDRDGYLQFVSAMKRISKDNADAAESVIKPANDDSTGKNAKDKKDDKKN